MSTAVVFRDVNLVPMDAQRLLRSHTVIAEDGLISQIGPSEAIRIPENAQVVEGESRYLIPGLANMHAHLMEFDPNPAHLALYLAGGVCTVRALNTHPQIFEWRDKVGRGEWTAPTILMSGPAIVSFPPDYRLLESGVRIAAVLGLTLAGALALGVAILGLVLVAGEDAAVEFARRFSVPWILACLFVSGIAVWRKAVPLRALAARVLPIASIVETPGQAEREVRRQAKLGVDCVKPYDHMDRETYLTTLRIAKEEGIYSVGHITEQPEFVPAQEAFEAGLDEVAHLDEFTHEFLVNYDPSVNRWVEWEVDTVRVDEIANLTAEYGVGVTATLVTNETALLGLEDLDALLERPEYHQIKPETIADWRSSGRMVKWRGQEGYRRTRLRPLWVDLAKALHRAGVPILLGTDTSFEGIVPGYSEHRELELLVEAGMTPYEALAAGTRNPAQIAQRMGAESNWGTIEIGNRADLVLLSDNPLEDVRNSIQIVGVMVRGRWLTGSDLDGLVSDYLGEQS